MGKEAISVVRWLILLKAAFLELGKALLCLSSSLEMNGADWWLPRYCTARPQSFLHENDFRIFFHSAIAYPTRSPSRIVSYRILVGSLPVVGECFTSMSKVSRC